MDIDMPDMISTVKYISAMAGIFIVMHNVGVNRRKPPGQLEPPAVRSPICRN